MARWSLRMAWGREFSLEAAGTLVAAAPSPGSILHHPGGAGWSWGRCGCHKDPCQTKLQFCRVPRMGGIKLQLLCGVRIELAVGSLPYPGKSGFPIVTPRRNRPFSGFLICKPCLDVKQNPSRDIHFPSYGRCPTYHGPSLFHLPCYLKCIKYLLAIAGIVLGSNLVADIIY